MSNEEIIEDLRGVHDRLQVGLGPEEMAIRKDMVIWVGKGSYDSYPNFGFQHFCWRNPPCIQELDMFIKYAKGKTFFWDCGSFHGIFPLVFQKINPESWSLAIEPADEPFKMLMQVCSQNSSNILCTKIALSDRNGFMRMEEDRGHFIESDSGEHRVKCLQGDILANQFSNPPDILKVDCEGMELKVLEGLAGIISSHHPTIFLELHLSRLTQQEIKQILSFAKWAHYNILDTATEQPISEEEILTKTGEYRVILL